MGLTKCLMFQHVWLKISFISPLMCICQFIRLIKNISPMLRIAPNISGGLSIELYRISGLNKQPMPSRKSVEAIKTFRAAGASSAQIREVMAFLLSNKEAIYFMGATSQSAATLGTLGIVGSMDSHIEEIAKRARFSAERFFTQSSHRFPAGSS